MTYRLIDLDSAKKSPCTVVGAFNHTHKKLKQACDHIWTSETALSIHCGSSDNADKLSKMIETIVAALKNQKVSHASIVLPKFKGLTPNQQLERMVLAFDKAAHQTPNFKSKPEKPPFKTIEFALKGADASALKHAVSIADGVRWTRHLANLPANHGTPTHIAEEVQTFAKQHKGVIKTKVHERKDLEKMKMGAFLAIAQGSQEPPKLIEIAYHGGKKSDAPVVLVGKGITFDSGGISLKPPKGMHEMKYDMGGAASVLGTIKACALMKLPINVVGLLACCENMPSDKAVKPGDVVTSMQGTTIEITNTDAEGRMVLCDTLTYAERFKPEFVIDVATLTGAVIVSLGRFASGFMTPDDKLAKMIEKAGQETCDFAWRLPLDPYYQKSLESPIADMINCSTDGEAGTITAATFLANFTKNFRWAHLDIAGTAWATGKYHNATGRPVPLLTQLLRDFCDAR